MPVAPTPASLWLSLMHAHAAMDSVARGSIKDAGLCYTDFAVLESLLHRGPLPVNSIATEIHRTSGSMTTAVDRLASRGLVTRAENPADKRGRLVKLTADGRALIEGAYARHSEHLQRAVDGALSVEQRSQLFALLRKLEKGVRT
jgi:MarR family transcriptional regulator, 2-MHQ and catechol-resistance regulon repressor